MKKLLYIGHSYHNKTKSTQFLQELLSTQYEIEKFDFDPYFESFEKFKQLDGKKFDVVVMFQIMPSMKELKKYLTFDKISFFPMYDGNRDLDGELWQEYKNCKIINFSKTFNDECLKRGFCSYYIQYFPKPIPINNQGDEKSVFLWQRVNFVNSNTVEAVLNPDNINRLYIHNVPDPKYDFIEPSEALKNKTEITTWFDTKQDLLDHIQKSAIYMAPRVLEGIGMSFLEAMAMGRCVVAPDNPTMNEYIENGKTGYLYDIQNPQRITLTDIRQIQQNTIKYIENGYKNWDENKSIILKWVSTPAKPDLIKMWKYYKSKDFIQNIFSMKNEYKNNEKYKIIKILGLRLSMKVNSK